MAEKEYILDGYQFSGKEEYDRAKKEKETIAYLTANTDSSDMKALLKIYNRSVTKNSFQTVIGWQYMYNLRKRLIGGKIVSEDTLAPVRVASVSLAADGKTRQREKKREEQASEKRIAYYKNAYENEVANQKIKNILIAVLIVVIIGMIVITATSRYSIFTYFTDYETDMRNEIEDEMEAWQKQLEQKEEELNQREADLQSQDTGKE